MEILESQNICLRALEADDLELLYRWENDSSVWEVSHTLTPYSLLVLKKYLETSHLSIFESKQLRLVIVCKENNEPIGLIDLFDFDPFHLRAGIGILIQSEQHRRKSYGSEALQILCQYAFSVLQLHQVYCNIASNNKASMELFKKQGFQLVGLKKEWMKTSNGWVDEYLLQKINTTSP